MAAFKFKHQVGIFLQTTELFAEYEGWILSKQSKRHYYSRPILSQGKSCDGLLIVLQEKIKYKKNG